MNLNQCDFYNESGMVCSLCQNSHTESELYDKVLSTKIMQNCNKYLHTAITENNLNSAECEQKPVICPICFAAALRLTELDDQLEILQKSIKDFVLIFSLKILHQQAKKINRQQQRNRIVELDISKFPGVLSETDLRIRNNEQDPLFVKSPHPNGGFQILHPETKVKIENEQLENTTEDESICAEEEEFHLNMGNRNGFNQNDIVIKTENKTVDNETTEEYGINPERLQIPLKTNRPLTRRKNDKCVSKNTFMDDSEVQSATVHRDSSSNSGNSANFLQHPANTEEGESFPCSICGKCYGSVVEWEVHLRTHVPQESYTCSHCTRVVSLRCDLIKHVRTHSKDKPFRCAVCEKAYTHLSYLTAHTLTHTDEKTYKCSYCPKAFKSNSYLTVHMRIHTGEKPYKCSLCSKGFLTSSHLTVHLRIHTGEKPYKCSVCSKSFPSSTNLAAHARCHTKKKRVKY